MDFTRERKTRPRSSSNSSTKILLLSTYLILIYPGNLEKESRKVRISDPKLSDSVSGPDFRRYQRSGLLLRFLRV
jgi:hypothetical protein